MGRFAFDEAYFDRFYRDPRTRVASPRDTLRLARFVCNYLKFLEQPVGRVIDLGCGIGSWRQAIHRHFPRATYTGVEVSSYLCRAYGWLPGSVVDFAAGEPFDLVICQGVLQYLDATQARRAARCTWKRSPRKTGKRTATVRLPTAPPTCDPQRGTGKPCAVASSMLVAACSWRRLRRW
jgi:SAM-dependent methyltransferase